MWKGVLTSGGTSFLLPYHHTQPLKASFFFGPSLVPGFLMPFCGKQPPFYASSLLCATVDGGFIFCHISICFFAIYRLHNVTLGDNCARLETEQQENGVGAAWRKLQSQYQEKQNHQMIA